MKKNAISIILGILTSFVVGSILLLFQSYNPIEVYGNMLSYGLFSGYGIANTLNRMSILLMTGLSAAVSLGSGTSNLGQFGQLLSGAMAATLMGLSFSSLPAPILIPLMLVGAAIVGACYSGIAIICRLFFKMNEFIVTLMLNFIAALFTSWLVAYPFLDPSSNWPMSKVVGENAVLPGIGNLDPTFIIALCIGLVLIIYKYKTVDGYETKVMGFNIVFGIYGGVRTKIQFIKTMLISGAVAGIAGGFMIVGSSQQNRFLPNLGEGFGNDGLMVSIVSNSNFVLVFLYSFIFSVIQSGSTGMQLETGVPSEFTVMLTAVTVLCVVAFRAYSTNFMSKIEMRRNERQLRKGGVK